MLSGAFRRPIGGSVRQAASSRPLHPPHRCCTFCCRIQVIGAGKHRLAALELKDLDLAMKTQLPLHCAH